MASFYLEIRPEPNKRKEHAIRLVIIIDGKVSRRGTGYSIQDKYWNAAGAGTGEVIKSSHPNAIEWNEALTGKLIDAKKVYGILDRNAADLNPDAIALALKKGDRFIDVASIYEKKFRDAEKIGTADRYKSQAKMINEFYPDIKIGQMTPAWANSFRERLEKDSYEKNTITGKLKFTHSVLNKAVADGLYPYNPMQAVKKGSYRPAPGIRLTVKEIAKLWRFIPSNHWDKMAKLTALFSYYASGARFKDVLLMPKSALYMEDKKPRLKWQPNKTKNTSGVWMDIPVSDKLSSIIKQVENDSDTIFGLINLKADATALDKEISIAEIQINKNLKLIMLKCGISKAISFNDMRRTFLKHFQDMTADIYLSKQAVGHDKVSTTEGYIGKNQAALDSALETLYAG